MTAYERNQMVNQMVGIGLSADDIAYFILAEISGLPRYSPGAQDVEHIL